MAATSNTINSVDISLEGKNRARLAMRKWDKTYTNVPNSALPKTLQSTLDTIYNFFVGQSLPLEDYTFLVRADETGKFKKVFSPAVFANPDSTGLLIKWGAENIPVVLEGGALQVKNSIKHTFKIKTQKINGYDAVVLVFSYTNKETKEVFTMPFPLRPASIEEGISEAQLELLVENNDCAGLLELVAAPPSGNSENTEYNGSGVKLEGPVIKMVELPVREFAITAFRRYKNSYGFQHLLQSSTDEPFTASVSSKDENGVWSQSIVEIVGNFILKANSSTNKKLMSDPVITEESPALLRVLGEDEFNGQKFVKTELEVSAYTADDNLFNVSF